MIDTLELVLPGSSGQPLNLLAVERYVAEKHRHQVRKDGSAYITHLREVANHSGLIAAALGLSEVDQATCRAAGYLHDTIEDQGVDFEDIVQIANQEVACYVAWLSDDKRLPSPLRHDCYMRCLGHPKCPVHVHIVKLADLYHNSIDALKHVRDRELREPMSRWFAKATKIAETLTQVQHLAHYDGLRVNFSRIARAFSNWPA